MTIGPLGDQLVDLLAVTTENFGRVRAENMIKKSGVDRAEVRPRLEVAIV